MQREFGPTKIFELYMVSSSRYCLETVFWEGVEIARMMTSMNCSTGRIYRAKTIPATKISFGLISGNRVSRER